MHETPTHFLNINYYLKKYLGKLPEPPLHPGTKQPIKPEDLEPIFAKELIKQEMTLEETVAIPEEILEMYEMFRPTPMVRAKRLEKFLQTPAHIYFKNESATISGSHKINTALAQAYYNKKEGVKTLITETGAGQWGSALSIACKFFGLKCLVFMVKVSYEQKPYRKIIMQTFGADVVASPSNKTLFGKSVLAKDPNNPGSLGIAISEALEIATQDQDTKYCLGSVLNHVLLHQTIIGQEAIRQMEIAGEYPDIVIGCVGGGSNFTGFATPFVIDKISGKKKDLRLIAVESTACPKMTKGDFRYDFGDTAQKTPLLKMETLGCDFIPPSIHAGGLRYHGNAPILSFLNQEGITEKIAFDQPAVFQAAIDFAQAEGIIPAPESAHAVKATIDEAIKCREQGIKKVIIFNLSGHGLLDLKGYEDFLQSR
ncbi:MAG: TrpB-like pyridoxal phosphate-dependent enzyme [Candidatus Gribaldobacteria bacterium]|nr:TrpB-like pyridoxal phosphate-dependent enzyme [Candidatus Gribaldobacteria bacterium]